MKKLYRTLVLGALLLLATLLPPIAWGVGLTESVSVKTADTPPLDEALAIATPVYYIIDVGAFKPKDIVIGIAASDSNYSPDTRTGTARWPNSHGNPRGTSYGTPNNALLV